MICRCNSQCSIPQTSYEARLNENETGVYGASYFLRGANNAQVARIAPSDYRYGQVTRTHHDSVGSLANTSTWINLTGHPRSEEHGREGEVPDTIIFQVSDGNSRWMKKQAKKQTVKRKKMYKSKKLGIFL